LKGSPTGSEGQSDVSPDLFRKVMGRFATGVTIVTAHENGEDYGMTVNAFLSVSLDPPSILVSLGRTTDTAGALGRTGLLGLSILASDQQEISERFATRLSGREKFRNLRTHRLRGVPVVEGSLGNLLGEVVQRTSYGTHDLFVARVLVLELGSGDDPLIFWASEYAERFGPRKIQLRERPAAPPLSRKGSKAPEGKPPDLKGG